MYKLKTSHKKLLADTHTPVSIYLKLRDKFPNSILLESSDYHTSENSFSYICCKPIASFVVENDTIIESFPDGKVQSTTVSDENNVALMLNAFALKFSTEPHNFKFTNGGLFGYMNYDAVKYFEDIRIDNELKSEKSTADVCYNVYQYVLVVNHFKNELYIFEHVAEYQEIDSSIGFIQSILENKNFAAYNFEAKSGELSNYSDAEFETIVNRGIEHCKRGDVFQIVLSREFSQQFTGDDFNVYRALRNINPSPYLFYFDYGNFKLFGSSPEAQIIIKGDTAGIYPIAGTYPRTGDDRADAQLAENLKADPKENSEHIMLVDLARNDLSRNAKDVVVDTFSEIQFYSHVIHMVSKVTGTIDENTVSTKIVADTFPAGTLSGAPKYNAMQLIDKYENVGRGFYGGAIGYMGFNGDFNHAIMIRTFLSKANTLTYQAGAGIVAESKSRNELQEVNNKLAALKSAIEMASDI